MAVDFIPEKFYVTRQPRGDSDEVLGFMVPMHKDGYASRKATADRWASGHRRTAELGPIEVMNVPLSGFSLTENKRRMMNKNVIWRCIHPEGFEFEITSDNFSDFLMEIDMQQGIIQTEMIFIRRSGENYLTWVGSPAHKEAVSQASIENKVSMKDLQIGDWFKMKNGEEGIYRGAVHTMQYKYFPWNYKGDDEPRVLDADTKSTRVHCYNSYTNNTIGDLVCGSISNIIDREARETTHTIQTLVAEMADNIKKSRRTGDYFMVDEKPFKLSDLQVTVTELPLYLTSQWSIVDPTKGQYDQEHPNIVLKLKDGTHVAYKTSYKHNYNSGIGGYTATCIHIGVDTISITIGDTEMFIPSYKKQPTSMYYASRRNRWTQNQTEIDVSDIETAYSYSFSKK